jgi:phytoene dehydrogenase-like protein
MSRIGGLTRQESMSRNTNVASPQRPSHHAPTSGDLREVEPLPSAADVVVIGAGLAGLTAGLVAARAGTRTVVLDAHEGGGRGAVRRVPLVRPDGTGMAGTGMAATAVFNAGPRALYLGGAAKQVLDRLGVAQRGAKAPTANSAALLCGRLDVLPSGPGSLARTGIVARSSKPRLLECMARIVTGRIPPGRPDQSATAWIDGLARGRGDVAATLGALFRVATYAADLDVLSADAAVPHVQHAFAKGVVYPDDGFQQFTDALRLLADVAGVVVAGHAPVSSVEQLANGLWRVSCRDGRAVDAAAVVVAAGGPSTAVGLLDAPDLGASLGPAATAACLELAVARPVPSRFVLGIDEPLYLSDHSTAAKLAPAGVHVVHVARYGATTASADQPRLAALASQAGIADVDIVARRFLAKMVVHSALPSVEGGGMSGRPSVAVAERPGVFLAGDWVGPVGLLADASLASGESAGMLAAAHVHQRGTRSVRADAAASVTA